MNLKETMLNEANQTKKEYILYDSTHMTFWKRSNYTDRKQLSGRQGLEVKEGLAHKAA